MVDTPPGNGAAEPPQAATAAAPPAEGPQLNALAQYAKDISFENPNAPRSLQPHPGGAPQIGIQVNVNAKQLSETDFEVELSLEGNAKIEQEVMFAFDLTYAGVFRAKNIPADQMHPVIMIECPRLLFPFARQIVAEVVRNGGFPPLYIDPIDFVGLYRQKSGATVGQAAAPSFQS